jgi:predicted peptidase
MRRGWIAIAASVLAIVLVVYAMARLVFPGAHRLSGLTVLGPAGATGALTPAFRENTYNYSVDVQSDIDEVAIVPRMAGAGAIVTVNRQSASSEMPPKVTLAVGDNVVSVKIENRLRASTVYAVTIRREDIQPVVDTFKKMTYRDPGTGMTMGYRLFVPPGYDRTKSYPLVFFLHGAGESGNDNEMQLTANQGATIWAKPPEQARHPCFVLAPQNPLGDSGRKGWTTLIRLGFGDPFRPEPALATAFAVLQRVMADYNVDRKRVYATGLSMGGFGVFAMNVDHPDTFAAVVGICGGLDPARAAALANKQIWVFHASKDPIVDVRFSRETVKALKEAGGNPRYTEYGAEAYLAPTAHQSWVPAYASAELRDWLFQQSR